MRSCVWTGCGIPRLLCYIRTNLQTVSIFTNRARLQQQNYNLPILLYRFTGDASNIEANAAIIAYCFVGEYPTCLRILVYD